MEVRVNDRIVLGSFKTFKTVQSLIDNLVFKEHEKGQVVTKVIVDGQEFAAKSFQGLSHVSLELINQLEIHSENPFKLAKNTYEVALIAHSELMIRFKKMVECFKNGYFQGGQAEASAFYEQLSTFVQLVIKPMELLDLETSLMSFEDGRLSDHVDFLYSVIREMETKQLLLDASSYGQWLINHLEPVLHTWERLVRYFMYETSKVRVS